MVNRVFIYGQFEEDDPTKLIVGQILGSPSDIATEAIEILREPSVLELIGKVYVLTASRNYQPVTPLGVRNYTWFKDFQISSIGRVRPKFYFRVKDGDRWQVLWIRQESDDSGGYIAVALRHEE